MRCSRLYSLAGLNTTTHRRQGHRSRWARPNGVPTVGGGWGLVYPATELPLCGKGRQNTPLARPGPREVWRSHFSARTAKPDRPGVWPLAGLAPFFLRPNANANANEPVPACVCCARVGRWCGQRPQHEQAPYSKEGCRHGTPASANARGKLCLFCR